MSGASSVELDFFGMEKGSSSKSQFQKLIEQRRNVRAVQTAISIINPQLLKTVIGSGASSASADGKLPENEQELVFPPNGVVFGAENPFYVQSMSKGNQCVLPPLPVFNPTFRAASESSPAGGTQTAPLTIFYNGTVSVFEIPHDKAEMIMKLAEEGSSKVVESVGPKLSAASNSSNEEKLLEKLNGDLPIARKKSLQRFLEKRKERLTTTVSPYANGSEGVVDKKLHD
ncbi:Tify [Macleaya cordata]|uniref:Protein TIFY n=1 Tax=Macleaya cordata TaxID=56857 RepID=A0A200QGR6_MACCD|nr:Tify [Macleaya cordata]